MTKKRHACDQLGVCQQLTECHVPCEGPPEPDRFPFAPGVIDAPAPDPKGNWLTDLIAATIAVGAVAAVAGFAMGYLNLPGWSL